MDEGGSRSGAPLSEVAPCGGPRGRAPLLGTLGYERKALETGISLFMGAQLGNLESARLLGTLRDGRKGLWRWSVSLYGSSVKGTWREGSLTEDPVG